MSHADSPLAIEPVVRVSTLELFFDLVFVFTITQLTSVLANDLTGRGVVQVVLLAGVIFWMYGGYAWLTNAVAPTNRFRRGLMLVGMGGFLAVALAIPTAFAGAGWIFGLAYLVINVVHSGLFLISGGPDAARAMARLAPLNAVSASLVLVGGIISGDVRYGLWAAALAVQIASPYLHPVTGFSIAPAHFVERHGLVIIVALGESIVAIGFGAAGLPVDLWLVGVAVLGLTLTYLMWWVYFGGEEASAEEALAAIDPTERARVAITAFGYAHYALLLGIVGVAAGVKKVVPHASGHLTWAQALVLGGGTALYLAGDVAFRWALRIGRRRYRAVGALVALATVPMGLFLAVGQLALLIVVLVLVVSVEDRRRLAVRP